MHRKIEGKHIPSPIKLSSDGWAHCSDAVFLPLQESRLSSNTKLQQTGLGRNVTRQTYYSKLKLKDFY